MHFGCNVSRLPGLGLVLAGVASSYLLRNRYSEQKFRKIFNPLWKRGSRSVTLDQIEASAPSKNADIYTSFYLKPNPSTISRTPLYPIDLTSESESISILMSDIMMPLPPDALYWHTKLFELCDHPIHHIITKRVQ